MGLNLLSSSDNSEMEFYVSDYTESFAASAGYFFPEKVELKKLELW
jgi:hypothetical protein